MSAAAKIGVVIPVHNGEAHLAAALESVLTQTMLPAQIVIVDDASEDASAGIALRFGERIEYVRRAECGGISAARNTGIATIRTSHIAFLDADDIWAPQKLEKQMAALRASQGPTMAFTLLTQFASGELSEDEVAALKFDERPLRGILASGLLIAMENFRSVGLFNENLRTGEFVEWYERARLSGMETAVVPEVLLRRRLHRQNHGRVRADARGDYARAIKSILDQRRKRM